MMLTCSVTLCYISYGFRHVNTRSERYTESSQAWIYNEVMVWGKVLNLTGLYIVVYPFAYIPSSISCKAIELYSGRWYS